jgi:anti-anti-sigma factor
MTANDLIVPGFDMDEDMSLQMRLDRVDDLDHALIIHLDGYVDTCNSLLFEKRITRIIDEGYTNLIFNCLALTYVSSTGIGTFTVVLRLLRRKGGDIALLSVQPRVMEVFELLGFSEFFNMKTDTGDAVTFFKSRTDIAARTFPTVFPCPACYKSLKAVKAGRFRCTYCQAIMTVDDEGAVHTPQ